MFVVFIWKKKIRVFPNSTLSLLSLECTVGNLEYTFRYARLLPLLLNDKLFRVYLDELV
jgi:hypothetical protein